ncbi:MAG: MFS transporter [Acidimicrobiales bacterium]|nr:MFS transporter [Acidimicrobiales bacterium]
MSDVADPPSDPGSTSTSGALADPSVHDRRWRILATVLAGLFAVNVTITILAVSIPGIAEEFGTTESTMTWAVTAPMLAFGVIGPLVGKLGDRLGHRKMFLWGMVLTAILAGASAMAWSAGSLIVVRTLSAIGGATSGPASFAIVSRVFPHQERVKALGYWAMVGAGGPVVGVVAGGPLIEAFGWRTLFLLQIPIAAVAFMFALRLLPETPREAHGRFDVAGAVLLALGVTPPLYAISQAATVGWTDPIVLACLVVSPFALVGFVKAEARAESPLLPLRYLSRPGFTFAIGAQTLINAAYMGSFVLSPLLMQHVLDYTETKTGLVSIARPLAFSFAGPVAGAVAAKVGPRWAATGGAISVTLAMAWMATLGSSSSVIVIMGALAMAGVGMGIAVPSLSASVTASVDPSDLGVGGAAQQMVNQVGMVVGIQVMQAVQESRVDAVGLEASFHWGYGVGIVIAALGVICAPRIVAATGTPLAQGGRRGRGRASDAEPGVEPAVA